MNAPKEFIDLVYSDENHQSTSAWENPMPVIEKFHQSILSRSLTYISSFQFLIEFDYSLRNS